MFPSRLLLPTLLLVACAATPTWAQTADRCQAPAPDAASSRVPGADRRIAGVGLQVAEESGGTQIVAVLEGSPAERAGIVARDRIVAIDNKPVKGGITDLTSRLRGVAGTPVVLDLRRNGVDFRVSMLREPIRPPRPSMVGIGITLGAPTKDREPTVSGVIPETPAAQAGLQAGDVLVAVDGQPATGTANNITALIRGAEGTPVTLTVRRGTTLETVSLVRSKFYTGC